MKKYTKIFVSLLVLAILIVPMLTFAKDVPNDSGIIPCGTDATGNKQCKFNDLIELVYNLINFVIKYLALPIAGIMFAYAGILLVTAPGDESKTKAKNIFMNVVWGLILAVGAWIIVTTFLSIAGYRDTGLFFQIKK
jgi:amino acid transporter